MQDDRYSRQKRLVSVGESGQRVLGNSHATVVGCGALGGICAELLARAGVGQLTVVDRDYVEASNLQRQFLFDESDARNGIPKAVAAERRLKALNSEIVIRGVVDDLRPRSARELLSGADVIIDATDNFDARYLINDWAVEAGVPWIYGAAVGTYGLTLPVLPASGPCFRCIYPEPPPGAQPTCETAGVFGPVTAVIGSLQAAAAIQILSGQPGSVRRVITTVDLWNGPVRELPMPQRDDRCPCCGLRDFPWLEGKREAPVSLCGQNAVQIHRRNGAVNLPELQARLAGEGVVRANEFALRFTREPYEITVFPDGRAIVKGTTDVAVARTLYAKWVGV